MMKVWSMNANFIMVRPGQGGLKNGKKKIEKKLKINSFVFDKY